MPTKNEIKFIKSLKDKKSKKQEGLFIAEGEKLVKHFLHFGLEARYLFCIDERMDDAEVVSAATMKKLTFFNHHSPVMAVFQLPKFQSNQLMENFILVLDAVRDPGNLGTILRLCDWFGIKQIVCTSDCVDVFNEKVVQASMGSIASVQVFTMPRSEIVPFLKENQFELVGTEMNGTSVYNFEYPSKCALVLGNEGQGLSQELNGSIEKHISIPAAGNANAESLNVANSAAIFLSEYYRQSNKS